MYLNLKRFTALLSILLLVFFVKNSVAQENPSISRGTHSIGGMIFPGGSLGDANLRYSYAFRNRMEVGINLYGEVSSKPIYSGGPEKTWLSAFTISPFYRYYLSQGNFGTFLDGGYAATFTSEWTDPSVTGSNSQRETELGGHLIYASLGIYYHGILKDRIGMELSAGAGAGFGSYYENQESFAAIGHIRLIYFFGNRRSQSYYYE